MNITFRAAEPSDVDAMVPLIYSSGPAAFEYAFKVSEHKSAQDFLKYAFVRPGSEFSYTNHTCVIDGEGDVVGSGAAFSEKEANGFTIKAIQYIFGFYGLWQGIKVIKRGLAVEQIIAPPKGQTEVLVHLGIRPDRQGRGFGSKMIQYFIENAQSKNMATASLDVSVENEKAMALYKRVGFKVTKKNPSSLRNQFSYVADHCKMHLSL